eukprot:GFUD01007023.1.p1 GENE.GFUD01007023.1~~GFUD01007023.1.p1  ORF type:complete len:455 (+),score=132.45 GFUD01007023.1:44-1408(+)
MDLPDLCLKEEALKAKVVTILSPLVIDKDKCDMLVNVFESELDKGLEFGLAGSSLQMENTFIPELLDGSENGNFLALDLGGTNFRVILLELENGKIKKETIDYYSVEESLRLGPGVDLFRFLAECIKDFIEKRSLSTIGKMPLGFTFSFPMTQTALDVGHLVNWTKSFNCPGVIGEDVVGMLNVALDSVGVENVSVVAILNDTTGTLVAGAHDSPDCAIGLILGTGTNASYIEQADRVIRWGKETTGEEGVKQVVMDPETGAFGDNGCIDFIKTKWDRQLDMASLLPGSFTYEKYFAGKYLGELVRLVFIGVMEQINQPTPESMKLVDSISTKDVSDIIADLDNPSKKTDLLIYRDLPSETSQAILQHICLLLSERAAVLVALTIATFLNRMARPHTVIAVTGSLYKLHPTLASRLEEHTRRLTRHSFTFQLCDDGSGKGAGLVAAIGQRLSRA